MQLVTNEIEDRINALFSGAIAPKPKDPGQIGKDADIEQAKQILQDRLQNLFDQLNANPQWAGFADAVDGEIDTFIQHVKYMI